MVKNITEVVKDELRFGFNGLVGNKGAVMVRFSYCNTKFCMINCHLKFGDDEDKTKERSEEITKLCNYHIVDEQIDMATKDHDRVFIFGDLNAKVLLENEECRKLIQENKLEEIKIHDEFWNSYKNMIDKGKVPKLIEEKIEFAPTYKFDIGTDNYDTSEKNRTPKWSDRILWVESKIQCTSYNSVPSIRYSDHKPVYGTFDVEVVEIIHEKKKKVKEDVAYSLTDEIIKSNTIIDTAIEPEEIPLNIPS